MVLNEKQYRNYKRKPLNELKCISKTAKLSDIFNNLNGIDMHIDDMLLPVSVYSDLNKNNLKTTEALLAKSVNELIDIIPRSADFIINVLNYFSEETNKLT
jgi:hypothetical protein